MDDMIARVCRASQFLSLSVLVVRRVSEAPNVAFYSVKERYLRWTFTKRLALNKQAFLSPVFIQRTAQE